MIETKDELRNIQAHPAKHVQPHLGLATEKEGED